MPFYRYNFKNTCEKIIYIFISSSVQTRQGQLTSHEDFLLHKSLGDSRLSTVNGIKYTMLCVA